MLQLMAGLKGSGKTKTLIDRVNASLNQTDGSVVCLEKGNKLIHEIKYQVRLLDTDEYFVSSGCELYGYVAGIYASNHDVTHIFIDSALKICNNDMDDFAAFIQKTAEFANDKKIEMFITASVSVDEIPDSLKQYLI